MAGLANNRPYSITWARSIVKKLVEKYPRATEILEAEFRLDEEVYADCLRRNDGTWPVLRDITHYIDRMIENRGYEAAQIAVKWYTIHLYSKQPDLFAERGTYPDVLDLTDAREWARLNSQGFLGGSGAKPEAKRPPSSRLRSSDRRGNGL